MVSSSSMSFVGAPIFSSWAYQFFHQASGEHDAFGPHREHRRHEAHIARDHHASHREPMREVATLVTATPAQALLDPLLAAQAAIVAQDVTIETAMDVRDQMFEILRKRISSVYQE